MSGAAILSVILWLAWAFSARFIPPSGRLQTLALALRGALFGLAVALTLAIGMTLTAGPRSPYFFRAVAIGLCLLGIPFGCLGSLAGSLRRP